MIERYPYRFKTEKEFIKEYGDQWRYDNSGPSFTPRMDYLFDTEYPFDIDKSEPLIPIYDIRFGRYWYISWYMLTENKPTKPTYKSKKILRTI